MSPLFLENRWGWFLGASSEHTSERWADLYQWIFPPLRLAIVLWTLNPLQESHGGYVTGYTSCLANSHTNEGKWWESTHIHTLNMPEQHLSMEFHGDRSSSSRCVNAHCILGQCQEFSAGNQTWQKALLQFVHRILSYMIREVPSHPLEWLVTKE